MRAPEQCRKTERFVKGQWQPVHWEDVERGDTIRFVHKYGVLEDKNYPPGYVVSAIPENFGAKNIEAKIDGQWVPIHWEQADQGDIVRFNGGEAVLLAEQPHLETTWKETAIRRHAGGQPVEAGYVAPWEKDDSEAEAQSVK